MHRSVCSIHILWRFPIMPGNGLRAIPSSIEVVVWMEKVLLMEQAVTVRPGIWRLKESNCFPSVRSQ
jgi:hypothetical protein